MKAKLLILIPVILIVAFAGVVWVGVYGPPIIIRNREYRELLGNFHQAHPREKKKGDENVLWDFHLDVPDKQTKVRVWAPAYPGAVTLQFEGESNPSRLYEYVDYSHAVEIRTSGNILYVHWAESLFRTDDWLIAYDLAERREIVRRHIDPSDLRQSH